MIYLFHVYILREFGCPQGYLISVISVKPIEIFYPINIIQNLIRNSTHTNKNGVSICQQVADTAVQRMLCIIQVHKRLTT